ncbi:MAG TPA: sensor domain-containing diguanylate cyclase [Actinomycetes bacterium]|nr:sensor domain-containing diguanylate cyclase [Actinomycetes bacterium]
MLFSVKAAVTLPSSPSIFDGAVSSVLDYLQERVGLRLWMLARVSGGRVVVLGVRDRWYGIEVGEVLDWDDLPFRAVADGRAPMVVPSTAGLGPFTVAPHQRLRVGAHAAVPIVDPEGGLFGCLCGLDPEPRPALAGELPILELLGRLLGTVLAQELEREELERRVERAELEALTDPLTGVGNRRAWDHIFDAEEARCRRYGSPASLVSVDLDELKRTNDDRGHVAGDALLRRTAQVIVATKRASDVVARLGGDEFGVLAVECDEAAAAALAERIRAALERAGIRASVGHATRRPGVGLARAWDEADAAMYAVKRGTGRGARAEPGRR